MTRDPLLPVRLVDGVWTTEDAGSAPVPPDDARSPWQEPGVKVRNMRCIPEPDLSEIVVPVTMDAEHVVAHGQRTVFAAVALDGSGVWAIGDTEQEARAGAVDRRAQHRHEAKMLKMGFPPPETDAAWLDTLAIVTLSGTTESLRVYVASVDDVIPWCPADLWDSGEVNP